LWAVVTIVLIAIAVIVAIAIKQASLLLVDIADCQIHLYKKSR